MGIKVAEMKYGPYVQVKKGSTHSVVFISSFQEPTVLGWLSYKINCHVKKKKN